MKRKAAIQTELLTQAEYARRRGVSRMYVNKLAKSGVLVMRDAKVDVIASNAVLDDRAKVSTNLGVAEAEAGDVVDLLGEPKTYAEARFTREVYVGRLRRLEFEVRNKSLIPAEDVTRAWTKVAETIKQRLSALPAKLAPVLAALNDERQIRKAMESEINAALRALAGEVRIGR